MKAGDGKGERTRKQGTQGAGGQVLDSVQFDHLSVIRENAFIGSVNNARIPPGHGRLTLLGMAMFWHMFLEMVGENAKKQVAPLSACLAPGA